MSLWFNMLNLLKNNLKLKFITFISLSFFVAVLLTWCWSDSNIGNFSLEISGFDLQYNWNIELKKMYLKDDDLDEIIDLYEEVWENLEYKDSLLVAVKYSQWLWINAFAQDNLDILEDRWLLLSKISKTQVKIERDDAVYNSVLVEYEISGWLIENVPLVYVSQLFIPEWSNVLLISYITESESARDNMSNALKKIN